MRRKVKTAWLGLVISLAVVHFGFAEEAPLILAPVYAGARTTHTWLTNYVSPQYMIDNSGITGVGRDATHTNAAEKGLFWHSADLTTVQNEWVEFDLGETYRVTNALVWQMAQAGYTSRGVQTFSMLVAGPDKVYTPVSVSNTLAQAGGAANEPVQVVPLVADDVRWVRFNIHTNWGNPVVVGLSEVRFEVYPVPQPPEPEPEVLIVAPNSATASTTYNNALYGPSFMIDNSGMTGVGRDATHTNRNAGGLFWHSDTPVTVSQQWVEFDLLFPYDLTNALIWQLAQKDLTTRGIKAFTILTAGDDYVFTTHSSAQLAQATGGANEPKQVVPLSAQNVRYVRFEIQSNWGAGGIVGLSEVRFEASGYSQDNTRLMVPIAVTSSSDYNVLNYGPQYLIDNSGMTGAGRTATHTHLNATKLLWHSALAPAVPADQWLEFDLGNTYGLHYALIWQLAQSNNTARGVRSFTLKTAGQDRVFSTASSSNGLTRASGLSAEAVQIKPAKSQNVRYVLFDIHSNFGGDCVGLSEVRFEVVPPATNGTLRSQVACEVSSVAAGYSKAALLDGSGLSGDGLCASQTNGTGLGNMWLSGLGTVTNEWLTFDFGREIDLTAAAVWQYNQTAFADGSLALGGLKRGVRWMTLHVAGNDQNFSEFGKVELAQGSGLAEQPAQFVGLAAAGVRYVKFEVNSNWGDPQRIGLGEVRFIYDRHAGTLIQVY
jgi:hypothetical protein